jgi:hypothetical protein
LIVIVSSLVKLAPVFMQRHKCQRFECVWRHLQWTRQWWNEILLSDESHFHLSRADGHMRVWTVHNRFVKLTTIPECFTLFDRKWNNMPQFKIQNTIRLMWRCCTTCINTKRGLTSYWLWDFVLFTFQHRIWRDS